MKIGIVLGSIRRGRFGQSVAEWVMEQVRDRDDEGVEIEFLDVRSFDLPLLEEETVPGSAGRSYGDERVTRWSEAVDSCDGFLFITAEYNHGTPGAFKNAYDLLGPEWQDKAIAFVSYGAVSGVRAVEQWRQVVATFNMYCVRAQASYSTFLHARDGSFAPDERSAAELGRVLDSLFSATARLRR